MKKPFKGIWATFSALDQISSVMEQIKSYKIDHYTIYSPVALPKTSEFGANRPNLIFGFFVSGAVAGIVLSTLLIVRMNLEWIQPMSAKPILAPLTLVPVIFELSILTTVVFTLIGMLVAVYRDKRLISSPNSKVFLNYNRFLNDRFGIVISCDPKVVTSLKDIFIEHHAEEIHIES